MAKEDWLQNEIQKLAKVLAKLLRLKLGAEDEKIVWEADESLKGLPGMDGEARSATEIAAMLIENLQTASQGKILSDIFKEKALAQERLELTAEAAKSFEIAWLLAIWADEKEGTFSFENMENIAFLSSKSKGN